MKKILLSISYFLLFVVFVQAQDLYSTTSSGGKDGGGTIIKFNPPTSTITILKSFNGVRPNVSDFVEAPDGKLYGLSSYPGPYAIYCFDPSTSTLTSVYEFGQTVYGSPMGKLTLAKDGKFYGVTDQMLGTIFSFDPTTSVYRKVIEFDGTDGSSARGGLVQTDDGKLYGMIEAPRNGDLIFSFDIASSKFTQYRIGKISSGDLIRGRDGKLYGVNSRGGKRDRGFVFVFDPVSLVYTILKEFDGTIGSRPYGSLLQATDGKLYGQTSLGGASNLGVIFSFDLSTLELQKVNDLQAIGPGHQLGRLIQADNGVIYGLAAAADINRGVIFSFDPTSDALKIQKVFENNLPHGSLVQAANGKLYGMAYGEGNVAGFIFSFDPSNSTYSQVWEVKKNAYVPAGGLVQGGDGKLYGMTRKGGRNDDGVLYSFDLSTFDYQELIEFDRFNSISAGEIIWASDGKFYGVSHEAGSNDLRGLLYSFDPSTGNLEILKNFDDETMGLNPSHIFQSENGLIYGRAAGGNYDSGIIFSFDPVSSIYKKLKDFEKLEGSPGRFIQSKDGNLYGISNYQGRNIIRSDIFLFDPIKPNYKILKSLGRNEGFQNQGFMQAKNGKFYGTMYSGGKYSDGVLFSFDPLTSQYTQLKDFDLNKKGAYGPSGVLIEYSDGKLYGMAGGGEYDRGVFYSYDLITGMYKKLKDYNGPTSFPPYPFIEYKSGTPPILAAIGNKSINELRELKFTAKATDKDTPSNLLKFSLTQASSGAFPTGAKIDAFTGEFSWTPTEAQGPGTYYLTILVSDGSNIDEEELGIDVREVNLHPTLYSTTSSGGKGNGGTIIKFLPSTNSLTVVKSFELNSKEGYSVTGSLIQGNDKKLYGMTTSGGKMGFGVIFSFDPATSTYTKLKDFDNINGANPRGGLMLANNNKLYGMTEKGGTNNKGVIFSFDPSNSTYAKLKDFKGDDGANPWGSLIQATDGKLYGMTRTEGDGQGGFYIKFSYGVIFSYNITTATYIKLKDFITPFFDDNMGKSPYGSLVQANNGILYGMTHEGGFEDYGTVFSFDPTTLQHNNFINFNDFENPFGSLIQANDGKLYGMNFEGGGRGWGEIFSINLDSNIASSRASFDEKTGRSPKGTLMQAGDGNLYGTTNTGGSYDKGVIFSYNITTRTLIKRKDFDGTNGAYPEIGSSFIEVSGIECKSAPVLAAIGNKSINELKKLNFIVKAIDKDSAPDELKFSLANATTGQFPEGATINKSTGLFTWTPTEAQGPGTYRVKIKVSDGTCIDEEEIEIQVCEINAEPVLLAIGNKTVNEGFELSFTAAATDSDLPANILTYSLAKTSQSHFPTGAVIHPSGGQFTWTPSEDQGPGIYHVKIVVSDGSCTVSEEIRITVNEVNSAPAFTKGPDQILYENAGPQVVPLWATHISKGDPGEETQAVHFTVSNTNKNLFSAQPTISPDGTLSFTPAINACGSATLNVILKDNGGTEFGGINQSPAQTFTITVKSSKILLSAYPNPFGKNAMVTFTLPADENLVILDVYDLKGSRVKRMYEGRAEANQTLKFEFDGSQLSAGMYFLRLATSKQIENFKLMMTE
ncbi:choice-of-anchor tandem repeat GloVer-containing protein [Daejeonella oryzae]|uniref:choice-of-anchor tandem repeat GloVer-containing protein n=1 Tax=Daejeonella oryzae TaxID=1122943 RepID=UPI00047CAF02|nr:choice-of-anchor tandem repeat GloVer-containing protein [Daejeonella oryzae]